MKLAFHRDRHDLSGMTVFSMTSLGAGLMMAISLVSQAATAQIIAPAITPPIAALPSPPPPKIEVPVVPKLDTLPPAPKSRQSRRGSFGDRVTDCLHQGAAAGLNPADRAAYSRACANQ